jgi:hypothetical protein
MKTIGFLLAGVLPLALLAVCTRAQPPGAVAQTGKVLVLENERTLEGDIERLGEQYRVRRSVGETWIQGVRVLRLCASLEEAYRFLRGRANLNDPDEHLRLAEWCRERGLREQALAEARQAVALRPDHPRSQRLLTVLEQAPAAPVAARAEAEPACPMLDVNTESLAAFATRVQPILMNACAGCHANGKGGAFKLVRSFEVGIGNRRHTQQNLTAVLGQVNLGQPQNSPLLLKAVSFHASGMEQPPLKGQQAAAYKTLEDWVVKTVAHNPQLREQPGTPTAQAAGGSAPTSPPAAFAEGRGPETLPAPTADPVRMPAAAELPSTQPTPPALLPEALRGQALPPLMPATPTPLPPLGAVTPAAVRSVPVTPSGSAEQPPGGATPGLAPARPGAGGRTDPDEFNRQVHPERK